MAARPAATSPNTIVPSAPDRAGNSRCNKLFGASLPVAHRPASAGPTTTAATSTASQATTTTRRWR